MRGYERRGGLGFGAAVGLGVAAALLITVIAVGRALVGQLEGAMRIVIVFAEITVCVILGGVVLAALGLLVYGGQLGRLKLAERRIGLEVLAREQIVRAEVLDGGQAPAIDDREAPTAIEPPRVYLNVPPDQLAAILRHHTEENS
ncbi:MAG: hypothetical protein ACRDPY_09690 [Streptosporangiaceae bacterium]